jgi:hypothetical protein
MPKRDPRYEYIKPLLNDGKLNSFLEIFKHVPKSVVAKDLGKKLERFSKLLERIDQFKTEELFLIAHFCKLSEKEMLELFLTAYLNNKSKIEKSKSITEIP